MAHFAKLDENNVVLEVHVVNNDALNPADEETSGIAFLTEWSGGYSNWKQTSFNNNIRVRYAGIGMSYNEELDAFIYPQCHPEATLDEVTCDWVCDNSAHTVEVPE
jgi:hypothetical protein